MATNVRKALSMNSSRRITSRFQFAVRLSAVGYWALLCALPVVAAQNTPAAKKVAVCSTTQIADFTRQIVGDRWEVISVLAPGEDPHTYEVGNDDLLTVKRADLCLENGWNLEGHGWMNNLAHSAGKPLATCVRNIRPLVLMGQESPVNDPHAWFNTTNAAIYVQNILAAVSQTDPEHAAEYRSNCARYLLELRRLDCWILEQVNLIPRGRRVLVTHHDAFGYFSAAYGFRAISPVGWTTGELTDVAVDQRQQIINQIRSLGVKSIFVETSINPELLDGIARDTGISIGGELYSDAMGAAGTPGETYLGMMQENVKTIVKHLK